MYNYNLGEVSHPDFDTLNGIMDTIDSSADSDETMEAILAETCDPTALTDVAIRRALKTVQLGGETVVLLTTSWMDGFIAGSRFQESKSRS